MLYIEESRKLWLYDNILNFNDGHIEPTDGIVTVI